MGCLDKYFQKRRILRRLDKRSEKVDECIRDIEGELEKTEKSYFFLYHRVDNNDLMVAMGEAVDHYMLDKRKKLLHYRTIVAIEFGRRLRLRGEIEMRNGRYYCVNDVRENPEPLVLLSS